MQFLRCPRNPYQRRRRPGAEQRAEASCPLRQATSHELSQGDLVQAFTKAMGTSEEIEW